VLPCSSPTRGLASAARVGVGSGTAAEEAAEARWAQARDALAGFRSGPLAAFHSMSGLGGAHTRAAAALRAARKDERETKKDLECAQKTYFGRGIDEGALPHTWNLHRAVRQAWNIKTTWKLPKGKLATVIKKVLTTQIFKAVIDGTNCALWNVRTFKLLFKKLHDSSDDKNYFDNHWTTIKKGIFGKKVELSFDFVANLYELAQTFMSLPIPGPLKEAILRGYTSQSQDSIRDQLQNVLPHVATYIKGKIFDELQKVSMAAKFVVNLQNITIDGAPKRPVTCC